MKTPRCYRDRTRVVLLSIFTLVSAALKAEGQVAVQLVSARDHIEGNYFGEIKRSMPDKDRVYLASFQGKLFVLPGIVHSTSPSSRSFRTPLPRLQPSGATLETCMSLLMTVPFACIAKNTRSCLSRRFSYQTSE